MFVVFMIAIIAFGLSNCAAYLTGDLFNFQAINGGNISEISDNLMDLNESDDQVADYSVSDSNSNSKDNNPNNNNQNNSNNNQNSNQDDTDNGNDNQNNNPTTNDSSLISK
jgi:hypothetical protein